MRNSIVVILSVIFMAAFFTGCGGGKEKSPSERLKGTWEIVEATGDMSELNVGTTYNFGNNNAFATIKGHVEAEGIITEKNDETLTVKFDYLDADFIYNYRFEGKKLIISIQTSNQEFTLEKR